MLKKGVGDIEDVLERNTKCINRGLRRLRAKLEENTQTFVPQTTEEDEEYIDNDSSEEEMEHLYNSPPITLMALVEEYNSERATERAVTFANANETRNICVPSPLGSRARAKIVDIQENLIIQGMPSANQTGTKATLGQDARCIPDKRGQHIQQLQLQAWMYNHQPP